MDDYAVWKSSFYEKGDPEVQSVGIHISFVEIRGSYFICRYYNLYSRIANSSFSWNWNISKEAIFLEAGAKADVLALLAM